MKKTFLSHIFLLVHYTIILAQVSPDSILNQIKKRWEKIEDYTVNVTIYVDIPFLRIPEKKAILYYKAPDKFHLETKGLTLFPRTASRFSGPELLRMPYTALYVRRERQGPLDLHVIKVIPLSDTGQVVLATLFIGTQDAHLYRVETITRDQGKVLLDFTPGDNPYGLPRRVLITFEVPHAELPAGFTGDIDTGLESESLHIGAQQKKFRGKVAINYENYRFNTGLREDIFIKKEKK